MFSDGLDEFDDSRETVRGLIEEYSEAEREDYLDCDEGNESM
jgi:tubulin gamma